MFYKYIPCIAPESFRCIGTILAEKIKDIEIARQAIDNFTGIGDFSEISEYRDNKSHIDIVNFLRGYNHWQRTKQ